MKLKYIFASIVATLALAVSCEKEADHYLDEVKLSTSYVSLSTGVGANTSITLTATNNWNIVMSDDVAKWLTVSPLSGSAGETTVTFTAPAYEGGRTAELTISCGDKTQFINVIQGVKTVSEVTCAEVMKNPGKTYRVTGTVTRIANTTYGNWNMDDGTYDYSGASADNKAGLYIYGTLDSKGNTKNFSSWGLEVGDKITVEGPSKEYNGTIELVDVTVIKIVKSLIKVDEVVYPNPEHLLPAPEYLPVAGGEAEVTLVNKGESLKVVIPEDAKSWLSISSLDGNKVTLKALPNEGGDRETTVTFGTNQGNEAYTCELTITQKGAIVAATVAEFLAAEVGTVQYRLSGVITSEYTSDKQGQSFYLRDATGEVLVYRLNDYKASGAKVLDVITVVGQRGAYKETAQMVNGVYESHVAVSKVSVAEFLAAEVSTTALYCLKGTITSEYSSDKQGQSFYMKDDSGEVLIYRLGDYKASGAKIGDVITVVGQRGAYKETPQMVSGLYVSHEAGNAGGGESTDKYVKVTNTPESWAGKFLIVWGNSAHATVSGSDLAATATVTISEDAIAASDEVNAAAVTIAASGEGYTITLPNGKYLTFSENKNKVVAEDNAGVLTLQYTSAGVVIKGKDTAGNERYLMENATGDTPFYRAYKATSFTNDDNSVKQGYTPCSLYKYVAANN